MTPDLDAVRAIMEGVTAGPWVVEQPDQSTPHIWIAAASNPGVAKIETCNYDDGLGERLTAEDQANASFIAAARELVPALAAEVRAQREAIAGLTARVEALRSALIGIRRASDFRRKERKSTGEDHEYYFHTADAALSQKDTPND